MNNYENLKVARVPLETGAVSLYPYSEVLVDKFTRTSRFGEEIQLYNVEYDEVNFPKVIGIPRGVTPVGKIDSRVVGPDIDFPEMSFTPRTEAQKLFVEDCLLRLGLGESFIAEAPTGFGKTVCGCRLIGGVGKPTLVVVPKEDLIEAWKQACKMVLGLTDDEIGVIQANKVQVKGKKVVIGMLHSLAIDNRYPEWVYKYFGFVIFDEVQFLGAETFSKVAFRFPALLRLGLSATPYRRDGKEIIFTSHIGPVAVRAEQKLLAPKVLVDYTGWKVPTVKKQINGKWISMQLPHEAGKMGHITTILSKSKTRNLKILNFALACYKKKRNLVIFSDRIAHLEYLKMCLEGNGVEPSDIGMYVGKISQLMKDRASVCPIILATYGMMGVGTNIPWLDACVLAIPRADVVQIVGRILREYPGKPQPLVLDLVDDDSPVYEGFFKKRYRWYKSIGATIIER
jgi:superfamily II DNA or RNA helicase